MARRIFPSPLCPQKQGGDCRSRGEERLHFRLMVKTNLSPRMNKWTIFFGGGLIQNVHEYS